MGFSELARVEVVDLVGVAGVKDALEFLFGVLKSARGGTSEGAGIKGSLLLRPVLEDLMGSPVVGLELGLGVPFKVPIEVGALL